MSLNLKKYESDMQEKWQEFVENAQEKRWILFHFLGQTEELAFYDSGDGGVEDFVAELSDGRVMYGAVVVTKKNTDISKIIFVLWQGKSVPTKIITKVHIYNEQVKKFFKGYHLILSAQTEEDLSENSIDSLLSTVSGIDSSKTGGRKVSAMGSKFQAETSEIRKSLIESDKKNEFLKPSPSESKPQTTTFQKPVEPVRKFEPVVTKPTVIEKPKPAEPPRKFEPVVEKPKPAEPIRKVEPLVVKPSTIEKSDSFEDKNPPPLDEIPKSAYEKPDPNKDIKTGSVSAARSMFNKPKEEPPKIAPRVVKPNLEPSKIPPQKSNFQPSAFGKPTPPAITSSRPSAPQAQKEIPKEPEAPKPPSRAQELEEIRKNNNISKLKSQIGFGTDTKQEPPPSTPIQQKPPARNESADKKPIMANKAPKVAEMLSKRISVDKNIQETPKITKINDQSLPITSAGPEIKAEALFDFTAEAENELSIREGETLSIINKDKSDWWVVRNLALKQGSVPSNYVKLLQDSYGSVNKPQIKKELVSIPVIALYDYKAAENNELSFKADEKLTIIICEEDSWWMAKNASGKTGLVPANYVEKIKEDQKKTFPAVKEQQKVASKEIFEPDAIAEYDYSALNSDEMTIKEGESLKIITKNDQSWWTVHNSAGVSGLVPANYLKSRKTEQPVQKAEPVKQQSAPKKQASIIKEEPESQDFLFEVAAEYDFTAKDSSELSFIEGQTLKVIKKQDSEWYLAKNALGKSGLIPINYVKEKNAKPTNTAKPQECSFEVEAQYDFKASQPDELSIKEGDILTITQKVDETWWMAKDKHGKTGLVPVTYVKIKAQTITKIAPVAQKSSDKEMVAIAIYDFRAGNSDELSFRDGENLFIIDDSGKEWWQARNKHGEKGLIPCSYVEIQEKEPTGLSSTNPPTHMQKYKAIYAFQNENSKELPLVEGEVVDLVQSCDDGWCLVSNNKKEKGLVPFNYLEKY